MEKNMGMTDRVIRFVLGIAALVGSFLVPTLTWQIVLWVVAAVLLITSATGVCLLYKPFGISTKK